MAGDADEHAGNNHNCRNADNKAHDESYPITFTLLVEPARLSCRTYDQRVAQSVMHCHRVPGSNEESSDRQMNAPLMVVGFVFLDAHRARQISG